MTTSTNLKVVDRDINIIGEVGVELIDGNAAPPQSALLGTTLS
jgi:hypothetical protein